MIFNVDRNFCLPFSLPKKNCRSRHVSGYEYFKYLMKMRETKCDEVFKFRKSVKSVVDNSFFTHKKSNFNFVWKKKAYFILDNEKDLFFAISAKKIPTKRTPLPLSSSSLHKSDNKIKFLCSPRSGRSISWFNDVAQECLRKQHLRYHFTLTEFTSVETFGT